MGQKVSIDGLADAVLDALREYNNMTSEELESIAKQVAKEGTQKLRETSPKGAGSKKGHYADGWGIKAVKKGANKFSFVIYNRKKPGLTHLLENGHQMRQGGRAKAIPHIKPVEEWCNEEFARRVKERLGK